MGRAPCCAKVGLHRGPWTPREDTLLVNYIQSHGEGNWRSLPKKAGLLRCGKSCRLRWMNYLRPDIKRGNIGHDEEDLIIRLHSLLGNRWSLIAGRLPGRTDNEIKNHWNTHLAKKLLSQGTDPNTHKKLEAVPINRRKRTKRKQKQQQTITTEKPLLHLPKPVRVRLLTTSNNNNNNNSDNNFSPAEEGTGSGSGDGILLWSEDDDGIDPLLGGAYDPAAHGGSEFESQSDVAADGGGDGSLQKLYQEYLELLKTNDDEHQLELDTFDESFLL